MPLQYAVQLSDFAALPSLHPLRFLLRPFLTEQTCAVNPGSFDGVGIVLATDAPDRLAAAMQVALSADMPCGYPIRIFERKNGRWARIRPEGQAAYKPATSAGKGE